MTWGRRAGRKLAEGEEDGDVVGWRGRRGGKGRGLRGEDSGEVRQGRCKSAAHEHFAEGQNCRRLPRKG